MWSSETKLCEAGGSGNGRRVASLSESSTARVYCAVSASGAFIAAPSRCICPATWSASVRPCASTVDASLVGVVLTASPGRRQEGTRRQGRASGRADCPGVGLQRSEGTGEPAEGRGAGRPAGLSPQRRPSPPATGGSSPPGPTVRPGQGRQHTGIGHPLQQRHTVLRHHARTPPTRRAETSQWPSTSRRPVHHTRRKTDPPPKGCIPCDFARL